LLTTTAVYARPAGAWSTICTHVVKPGETIYCIARAYGVDPWAIAAYNGITNPNLIYSGQVLAIPNAYAALPAGPTCAAQCPAPPACTCTAYHTVVTGNNLYRISLYYGVSMWRIAQCNAIYNLNYIRVGDVLCIPTP
jgi:putative chitinase